MGVMRMCRAWASAWLSGRSLALFSATAGPPVFLHVALEGAGRGELAQLVPDHRLGDEHRDVLAAVVHGDRVAQHVRDDHRAPGPRLDDVVRALLVLNVHLLLQVVVHEGTLLETARHLDLLLALLVRLATADDELVAGLARLAGAALLLAPRGHRVASAGGLALTTAVRVVDRVHRDAADGRALALPPHAAGLAPVDVALLGVADLADGRAAARVDVADLAGGHAQLRVGAVLGDELHAGAGRAGDLRAAAGPQLDGVDDRAGRDVAQRQVVARLDVGVGARLDPVALLQLGRRDDVALRAVGEVQQRDARGAVRVVLDVRDLRRHAVLVVPTEVDDAVGALVTAALVADRHSALRVAAALRVQRPDQGLLGGVPGDLDEVGNAGAAATGGRRLVLADAHGFSDSSACPRCPVPLGDRASEDVDPALLA